MAIFCFCSVSGDANFHMSHTSLTVGGFIQPSMAKALIEMAQNVEKGLCQRFLWLAPKPVTVAFDDLKQVDSQFSASVGKKICSIGNETGEEYSSLQATSQSYAHDHNNVVRLLYHSAGCSLTT